MNNYICLIFFMKRGISFVCFSSMAVHQIFRKMSSSLPFGSEGRGRENMLFEVKYGLVLYQLLILCNRRPKVLGTCQRKSGRVDSTWIVRDY